MKVLLHTTDVVTSQVVEILQKAKELSGVKESFEFAPLEDTYVPPRGVPVLSLGTPPKEVSDRCRVIQAPSVKALQVKADSLSQLSSAFKVLANPPELPDFEYTVIQTAQELQDTVDSLDSKLPITFDIEVAGDIKVDTYFETPLISMAFTQGAMNWVVPEELCIPSPAIRKLLLAFDLIGHNLKFDLRTTNHVFEITSKLYWDTQLAHFVLYPASESGLKPLAKRYFGVEDWDAPAKEYTKAMTYKAYTELEDGAYASARRYSAGSGYERIPRTKLYRYNAFDVFVTHQMYLMEKPMVEIDPLTVRAVEDRSKLSDIYTKMETKGFRVDLEHLQELKVFYEAEKVRCWAELHEYAGFAINPNSPMQVKKYFADVGSPVKSTNKDVLKLMIQKGQLNEQALGFVKRLQACRGVTKALSTYVLAFIEAQRDGIIYPTFKLSGAVTGRLSTPGTGIMVIPREERLRKMVVPYREGHVLVKPDFGQLEARVVAFESRDPRMVDAFQPNRPDFFTAMMPSVYPDKDLSGLTKAEHKELRNGVKPFSHGLNYGRSAKAIAESLGMPLDEATRIATNYLGDPNDGLMAWQQKVKEAVSSGEPTVTPYGLRLQAEVITKMNRSSVMNNALAFTPQSVGNSICLDALIHIDEWISDYGDAYVFATVHDQILASVPIEYAREVGDRMEAEMVGAGNRYAQGVLIFEAAPEYGFNWVEAMDNEGWEKYLESR